MERLGTVYGGWHVPREMCLTHDSVVYCAGVGEDMSFELYLSHIYGCNILCIDPTKRAARHFAEMQTYLNSTSDSRRGFEFSGDIQKDYMESIQDLDRVNATDMTFQETGLWEERKEMRFYKQTNPAFVSQSLIPSMFGQDFDTVQVDTLRHIMESRGHAQIDLLKMDIEGAEVSVLKDMLRDGIFPRYLCVEFDLKRNGKDVGRETEAVMVSLEDAGYVVLKNDQWNVTFEFRAGGKESKESKDTKRLQVVHYCCGSYETGDTGGVARFDFQVKLTFPHRKFFQGPSQRTEMLKFISGVDRKTTELVVITDNHLACDFPPEVDIFLVHHGVAETHAERDPDWSPAWRDLCCSGQDTMLEVRRPENTHIISISTFCTEEFTRHYGDAYTAFPQTSLWNTSELDPDRVRTEWAATPGEPVVVLGNFAKPHKGRNIIPALEKNLAGRTPAFITQSLTVKPRGRDFDDFNKRKQDIYLGADVFLQLSTHEGDSYASKDALLCGLVVVATDVGAFFKDVPDDCFVRLDWKRTGDAEYVAEKIMSGWQNREVLGRNAREWVAAHCSFADWQVRLKDLVGSRPFSA